MWVIGWWGLYLYSEIEFFWCFVFFNVEGLRIQDYVFDWWTVWCRVNICDVWLILACGLLLPVLVLYYLQSWINQNFTRGIGAFVKGSLEMGQQVEERYFDFRFDWRYCFFNTLYFSPNCNFSGFVFSVTNSRSFRYFTINEGSLA
jgi:hypothetical protein